jgi:hypothetical protein
VVVVVVVFVFPVVLAVVASNSAAHPLVPS